MRRRRSLAKTLFPRKELESAFRDMTKPLWGKYDTTRSASRHMRKVKTDRHDPLRRDK